MFKFLKEAKTELKKVIWPDKRQTTIHTFVVIGISLAVSVFLGMIDFLMTFGVDKLLFF